MTSPDETMRDDGFTDVSRRTVLGGLAGMTALGMSGGSAAERSRPHSMQSSGISYTVEVTQQKGKPVNWVLPGPRRISEEVFGTPDNPLLGDAALKHAKKFNPKMADLLDQFPTLVALPEDMRQTNDDGSEFTITSVPTAFSDEARPVEGSLNLTYRDRAPWAGFLQGQDEAKLDVQFTDPEDNTYRGQINKLDRKQETHAGGVLVGGLIHGKTGIGSPLFPQVYNYASFWGVGTLDINDGEQTLENRVIHFMTTQMARDNDYALAVDENMPLDWPFLGRSHHTHGFFFPIKMTEVGPTYDPLDLPFPSNKDQGQPFIHIMFDMDEVTTRVAE